MNLKIVFQILIIFLSFISIKQASINIPFALKNVPVPKLLINYHNFITTIEYLDIEYNNKSIESKIDKMNDLIERVPEILSNLLLSNGKKGVNYNETLLQKLKIKINNLDFIEKNIKTDFLAIIHFVDDNNLNKDISSSFYTKDGKNSPYYEKQRYAIGYIKINYNYKFSHQITEDIFVFKVLREILRGIGFRINYLKNNFIRNKFDNAPLYLINNSKIYKSHIKYSLLSGHNIINNTDENSYNFYKSFWNFIQFDFHDIMNTYNDYPTITEFTLNVLKEIEQITLTKCDLFEFEQGVEKGFHCLRVNQDCINKKQENNYFLEYGIYNGTKIKCYLNDKNNIKNKQCGIKYGNLEYDNFKNYFTPSFKQIKDYPLIGKRPIPELNFYKNQSLKLLRNPLSCKPGTPRTIFFQVPPTIFDEEINNTNISILIEELKEINKDVLYDNITLKEKERKYFVTYQTAEEEYKRSCVTTVLNYSGLIRSFSNFHSHNLLLKLTDFNIFKEIGIMPSLQKIHCYTNVEIVTDKFLEYNFYNRMKNLFPQDFFFIFS